MPSFDTRQKLKFINIYRFYLEEIIPPKISSYFDLNKKYGYEKL